MTSPGQQKEVFGDLLGGKIVQNAQWITELSRLWYPTLLLDVELVGSEFKTEDEHQNI